MTILRDLLRKVPFPLKFRVAKMLFRLGRPAIGRVGALRGLATPKGIAQRPLKTINRKPFQLLVVLDRLPLPTRDAARVRILAILHILSKVADVTLIPLYHRFEGSRYEQSIHELGIEIVGVFDFEEFLAGRRFDAALISYPHVTDYFLPEVRRNFPDAKVIFDTVDVQFIRLGREAEVKRSLAFAREAAKLKRIETRLANAADQTWCVTWDDREFLRAVAPEAEIRVVPNIHKVQDPGPAFEKRQGLFFIGNFEHRPNVDAVEWLIDEILPIVRGQIPDVKLHIVGGGLPGTIAERLPEDCVAHGFAEDISGFFRECRVFVAPLRFGGGMKGKVGEALSYGLPVVTTGIGAEGFGLVDGKNILLAEDAAGFAAKITRAYHNKEMWQTLSDHGRDFITANLSPEAVELRIREALNDLLPARAHSER